MKQLVILISLFALTLTGCATSQPSCNTTNLKDLKNLTLQSLSATKPTVGRIRIKALKETAMTIGAQGGLAIRSEQLNNLLTQHTDQLSKIFNFNGLMLDHNVLPPVLEQNSHSFNLTSSNVIRLSDRIYRIIKQAKFVTTPPTWRDYLWLNFKKPELPDSTLLPKNSQERKVWKKYVTLGWEKGIAQANNIYNDSLAKLQRNFKGMILYRKLLSENMVSQPFVAKSNMGVTSNSSRTELRINDQILRITSIPKLKSNSKQWNPVMVQE